MGVETERELFVEPPPVRTFLSTRLKEVAPGAAAAVEQAERQAGMKVAEVASEVAIWTALVPGLWGMFRWAPVAFRPVREILEIDLRGVPNWVETAGKVPFLFSIGLFCLSVSAWPLLPVGVVAKGLAKVLQSAAGVVAGRRLDADLRAFARVEGIGVDLG